jgi:glutamyl-tRNA synthetase
MCQLYRERCSTLVELADWLQMYFQPVTPAASEIEQHMTDAVRPAVLALKDRLAESPWDQPSISACFKATLGEFNLKMPQLATPVRLLVCGRAQTPSVDAVLALFSRDTVLERLRAN